MSASVCPLCGENNQCAMEAGEKRGSCWCVRETFPKEIFDLLPEESRMKQCICNNCLTKFTEQKG